MIDRTKLSRRAMLALVVAAGAAIVAPSARADTITVTHYGSLFYGAPFAVALDQGYFKQQGVPVDGILTAPGGGTPVRNTLAAGIPYGEAGLPAILAAKNSGLDLIVVNTAVNSAADAAWVTLPNSPFASIKDLIGKKLAITNPKSGTELHLKMALNAAGIAVDRVEILALGGISQGLTALSQGAVDAAPIVEPLLTRSAGKFKPVFRVADLLPEMTQTVGFARRDWAASHPAVIKGIIAARRQAVDFIYADPVAAGRIIAKAYDKLEEAVAIRVTQDFVAAKFWSRGEFSRAGLDVNIVGLQLLGVAEGDKPVDWSNLIDQGYLPEDLKRRL